eukprot:1230983-Prymnesium_polylepis.3
MLSLHRRPQLQRRSLQRSRLDGLVEPPQCCIAQRALGAQEGFGCRGSLKLRPEAIAQIQPHEEAAGWHHASQLLAVLRCRDTSENLRHVVVHFVHVQPSAHDSLRPGAHASCCRRLLLHPSPSIAHGTAQPSSILVVRADVDVVLAFSNQMRPERGDWPRINVAIRWRPATITAHEHTHERTKLRVCSHGTTSATCTPTRSRLRTRTRTLIDPTQR